MPETKGVAVRLAVEMKSETGTSMVVFRILAMAAVTKRGKIALKVKVLPE